VCGYCVLGCAWKRRHLGVRGCEAVPNLVVWRALLRRVRALGGRLRGCCARRKGARGGGRYASVELPRAGTAAEDVEEGLDGAQPVRARLAAALPFRSPPLRLDDEHDLRPRAF
jgi:hypothetical protein